MSNVTNPEDWPAQQRLIYLEDLLWVRGWFRSGDLMRAYRISRNVASADVAAYGRINPKGIRYNRTNRRHELPEQARPYFRKRTFEQRTRAVLAAMGSHMFQSIRIPSRSFSDRICRDVTQAMLNRQEVEIRYLSVHSGTAAWRWITPIALVDDGQRLHVRAWCAQRLRFLDFNLGRVVATRAYRPAAPAVLHDPEQDANVEIEVAPRRGLSIIQRRAVETDFGMKKGRLRFSAPRPHFLYIASQLGLLPSGTGPLLRLIRPDVSSATFTTLVPTGD